MFGLDLYQQFNTVTDWNAVRSAGVQFVYVKLTDGGGQAIVHGDAYVAGARAAGIQVGGYHYMEASPSPEAQADTFTVELRRLNALDLAPALDLEEPSIPAASRVDYGQRFLRRLQSNLGGAKVTIYSSGSWFAALHPDTWGIPNLVDWVAEYGVNDGTEHPISSYSGHVDAHQFTSVGHIAGISGSVDEDDASPNILNSTTRKQIPTMFYAQNGPTRILVLECGLVFGESGPTNSDAVAAANNVPIYQVSAVQLQDFIDKGNAVLHYYQAVTTFANNPPASVAGGATPQQLTDAVTAGVKAGLAGVTETTTFIPK